MVLPAGSNIGGYIVEDVLGSGGMGTVYRARHPVLPRSDALKVLSAELSRDEHFRARFEREAELAATLDHPNIVAVLNRGETDGQLWIAMQYVAGSDGERELAAGRMTPQRAVHITGEVAKALDYAHRRNLLHRDIKPANFLLSTDDERIFLADFGIARALDDAVNLTQTGTVMATIAYAAPETLAGEPADHRADVYSLGCSLYRMLTGTSPFSSSGGMAAVAAAHLMSPPPRPTDVVANLPAAMDTVIARAMAKEPIHRYQSAGDLARAAAAALDETTAEVRITPAPSPAQRPPWGPENSPPHWSGPHTGTGPYPPGPGWSTGPTPATGWPTGPGPAAPMHLSSTRKPRSRRTALAAAGVAAAVVVSGGVGTWMFTREDTPAYAAQTLVHAHGEATLTAPPTSIVAAGPGDGDAVLSLGVQPAAIVAPPAGLPSWEKDLITGDTQVLTSADPAQIAAAKPDLIIDTGDIDAATYRSLAEVATTITRAPNATEWSWQTQLQWVGRILDRTEQAQQLIDEAAESQAKLRTEHPVFDGKSVEVVFVADDGISVATPNSAAAQYLQGLGFRYLDKPAITASADGSDIAAVADPEQLNTIPTDVRIVARTDSAAGGGSYNGLPDPFTKFRGATIIVDDTAAIDALRVPGYAATAYLNTALVNALSRQIR
ncbi:transmembrane serine/threonine-protein kinase PknQ [Mycolicibacterium mageritense DSM 44476 = CIP 104973]|uniref:serine/threonine-protein kinase n=1 Tax=Mycolicibacterium mageritense TaxID=53462 RepID=UPI0027E26224|nr:serine/threonine-protein kinase [Mycolicibacterium mageritense]